MAHFARCLEGALTFRSWNGTREHRGSFYGVDPVALTVTLVGEVVGLTGSGAFGAAWTDTGGTPEAVHLASSSVTSPTDGGSCPHAPAPAGTPDVDGATPELDPTHRVGDAGIGGGATCPADPSLAEDRLLTVANATAANASGHVGLVTSLASVAFESVTLIALPA